jgi:uncharacterized protein YtpQ (UPF0354 family)
VNIHEDFEFSSWTHPQVEVSIDHPTHWRVQVEASPGLNVSIASPPDDGVSLELQFLPFQFPVSLFDSESHLQETLDRMVLQHPDAQPLGRSKLFPYPAAAARLPDGSLTWVTMHLDRLVVFQTDGDPEQQKHFLPVFERMLQSFRIHSNPQAEIAVLLGEVVKALAATAPEAGPQLAGDYIEMGSMQVRVDNLAANIRNAPQQKQNLIREFVTTTVETWRSLTQIADVSWDEVCNSIYPMVRPDSILRQIKTNVSELSEADRVRQRMLATPWLANLVICYAIDSARTLRFVLNHDLERWGLDADVVKQQAMQNLAKAKGPTLSIHTGEGSNILIAEVTGNELPSRSSWILHPNLHRSLQRVCKGPIWAAVPSRDCMMVFGATPQLRKGLQELLDHDFKTSSNPVSDRLFAIQADGVVLA